MYHIVNYFLHGYHSFVFIRHESTSGDNGLLLTKFVFTENINRETEIWQVTTPYSTDLIKKKTQKQRRDRVLTLAPTWFPHCPAWRCTISLMLSVLFETNAEDYCDLISVSWAPHLRCTSAGGHVVSPPYRVTDIYPSMAII